MICLAASYRRELEVFYHPDTLREICALREYLLARDRHGTLDGVDRWIRMVAVNRLTGHSPGLLFRLHAAAEPGASIEAQAKINARRKQVPPRRDVRALSRQRHDRFSADCDTTTRAKLLRSANHARF